MEAGGQQPTDARLCHDSVMTLPTRRPPRFSPAARPAGLADRTRAASSSRVAPSSYGKSRFCNGSRPRSSSSAADAGPVRRPRTRRSTPIAMPGARRHRRHLHGARGRAQRIGSLVVACDLPFLDARTAARDWSSCATAPMGRGSGRRAASSRSWRVIGADVRADAYGRRSTPASCRLARSRRTCCDMAEIDGGGAGAIRRAAERLLANVNSPDDYAPSTIARFMILPVHRTSLVHALRRTAA